jgi:hypothetical protein
MNFVKRLTVPRLMTMPKEASDPDSPTTPSWRAERSGHFGEYAVSGWRYTDLAIWHVKVWSAGDDNPVRSYVVSAGEFYPDSVTSEDRFAILRLIAFWDANGFNSRATP